MQFKVYRDYAKKGLRRLAIELCDAKGKVIDRTYMCAFIRLGLNVRLKLRKARMMQLYNICVQSSEKI